MHRSLRSWKFYNANRTMLTLKNFQDVIENCRATKIEKQATDVFEFSARPMMILCMPKKSYRSWAVASAKLATTGLG